MSSTLALRQLSSGNYDIAFDSTGQITFVTEKSYVAQRVTTRLQLFLGEWFLDTSQGVDWWGSILTKPFNPIIAEGLIKATILNTPDVTDLLTFEATFSSDIRTYDINCSIDTIYGETTVGVSNG